MRQDIVDTARRLIERVGLSGFTLRAIARELGYTPAALYEYFPSKEAIAKAVYFEGADGLSGLMERALAELPPETPPVEAKKELGRAYRRYALERRELFLLIFGSGAFFGTLAETMEGQQNAYDSLLKTVQRGVERGDFVQAPAEMIALTSWSAIHGFVMIELAGFFEKKSVDGDGVAVSDPGLHPDQCFEMHMDLIDSGVQRR